MNVIKGFLNSLIIGSHVVKDEDFKSMGIGLINKEDFNLKNLKTISTLTGDYFEGFLNNANKQTKVMIKLIKTKLFDRAVIISELNMYKDNTINKHFPKLLHANINYETSELYLIFQEFKFCYADFLSNNSYFVKYSLKERYTHILEIIVLLEKLSKHNKVIGCMCPASFVLVENCFEGTFDIKLIEPGYLLNFKKIIKSELNFKYVSPEMIHKNLTCTFASDLWSFGVMCLDILSDKYDNRIINLDIENDLEIFKNLINNNEYPFKYFPYSIKGFVKDLILRCFEIESNLRIRIEELSYNFKLYYDSLFKNKIKHRIQHAITGSVKTGLNLENNLKQLKEIEKGMLKQKRRRESSNDSNTSLISAESNTEFDEYFASFNSNNGGNIKIFEDSFEKIFNDILHPHLNCIENFKNQSNEIKEDSIKTLEHNYESVKQKLDHIFQIHKSFILKFHNKVNTGFDSTKVLEDRIRHDFYKSNIRILQFI